MREDSDVEGGREEEEAVTGGRRDLGDVVVDAGVKPLGLVSSNFSSESDSSLGESAALNRPGASVYRISGEVPGRLCSGGCPVWEGTRWKLCYTVRATLHPVPPRRQPQAMCPQERSAAWPEGAAD